MGDVVVWDNASLLHSATLIDPDDARTLWRITDARAGARRHGAAGAGADVRRPDDVAAGRTRDGERYSSTTIVPSMSSWPLPQNTSQKKVNVAGLVGRDAHLGHLPGMIVGARVEVGHAESHHARPRVVSSQHDRLALLEHDLVRRRR